MTATAVDYPNYCQPPVSFHWETSFKYVIFSGHWLLITEIAHITPPSMQTHIFRGSKVDSIVRECEWPWIIQTQGQRFLMSPSSLFFLFLLLLGSLVLPLILSTTQNLLHLSKKSRKNLFLCSVLVSVAQNQYQMIMENIPPGHATYSESEYNYRWRGMEKVCWHFWNK